MSAPDSDLVKLNELMYQELKNVTRVYHAGPRNRIVPLTEMVQAALTFILAEIEARVAELEAENERLRAAAESCIEYWNGSRTDRAMSDALETIESRLHAALLAKPDPETAEGEG